MKKTILFFKCSALVSVFVFLVCAVSGVSFNFNETVATDMSDSLMGTPVDNMASVAATLNTETTDAKAASEVIDAADTAFSAELENSSDDMPQSARVATTLSSGCVVSPPSKTVITISPSDNPTFTPTQKYACIKAKIEGATKGQTIMFQAGTYPMSPEVAAYGRTPASEVAIIVPSGVTIKGAGPTRTIFKLTNPKYPLLFRMTPLRNGVVFATTTLKQTLIKGSSEITVRRDQGPVAYFEIVQPNDLAYINSLYSGSLIERFGSLAAIPTIRTFRGKFTRQSVQSDGSARYSLETITPASPGMMLARNTIPHTFAADTVVRTIQPVTNVILQDFSIEGNFVGYPNSAVDDSDFSNVADASLVQANSYAAILVDYANETVELKNISVNYAWSRGVEIKRSVGTKLRYVKVSGAHNKGVGGNGYGIALSGSTNVDATDLVILNNRHGLLFNAQDSEHFNFVKIANTNRDINFHGLLDSGNVVSVGTMNQEYAANTNATWAALHYDQARNHVPTVRTDNTVYFSNVSASLVSYTGDPTRQNDNLVAAPGGGIMYGRLGNDLLTGNVQEDELYGGVGQDHLYGMGGNDKLSGGDEADVLDGGIGNDRIVGDAAGDTLDGGPGSDVFVYNRLAESVTGAADVIKNFSVTEDQIDLTAAKYTKANLQSSFDGTYTILTTKNFKNPFELRLVGKVDFNKIMLVPLAVADATPQSFWATVRQNLVAAVFGFLSPEPLPTDSVLQ